MLDTTREKGQIFFSLETMPLQKFVFSTTPWVLKNAIISSTVIVRITFEPLQTTPGRLLHSVIRKKGAKVFYHREDSLFLKILVLDFLGPEEMMKSRAQFLSK